tara:strand:+ start:1197 stop:1406 length:210 start_codon:yes stop_codon:yes gene_type:complete
MNINDLIEIYKEWGEINKIKPLLSADELLAENILNENQTKWLKEFIIVWGWLEEEIYLDYNQDQVRLYE